MRNNYTDQVLAVLSRRPGLVTTLDDLVRETGLPAVKIQATIANLRSRWENRRTPAPASIETVDRGRSWILHPSELPVEPVKVLPKAQPAPKVNIEEVVLRGVGRTKDGEMIVRDDAGALYRVYQL